ncbi:MAG: branched-chain amino acid transporter AzlC [Clostridiales bacterium]|nr:branched-chain amino acid transporter AzlC [Clostridiales bacterium]
MTGYLVLGMGFGIILDSRGYGVLWSFLMSFLIYAGSMQYLAVDLLTAGASLITAAFTTLMVNARHLFYGISMTEKYKGLGAKKPYMIFALTDETYSLVVNDNIPEGVDKKKYWFLVSLLDQFYWVAGSVIGSLIGSLIKFDTTGLDFALTALFVTIFTDQWLSTKNHTSAITGLLATFVCLVIFGSGNFLIPSMILITVSLTLLKKTGRGGL